MPDGSLPTPVRYPLATRISQRNGDYFLLQDAFLRNCYIDKDANGGDRTYVHKRPGAVTAYTVGGGTPGTAQGLWYFKGFLFAARSNVLYNVSAPVANNYATGAAWTQDSDGTWQARYKMATCIFNGSMWVIGGIGASVYNDIWSSPDGQKWTQVVSAAPWSARQGAQVVVLNNQMFLIGGADASGYLNDVWVTPDGVNWTQLTANAAFPGRTGHRCIAFNNGIFLMGGFNGAVSLNDVWFSTDGVTWAQQVVNASWAVREEFGLLSNGAKMFVVGGENTTGAVYHNDCYSSPDGITWTLESAAAFGGGGRAFFGYTEYNGAFWVVGGSVGGVGTSDVYTNATGSGAWTLVTAAPGFTVREGNALLAFQAPSSVSSVRAPILWNLGGFGAATFYKQVWRSNINGAANASWTIPSSGGTAPFDAVPVDNNTYLMFKDATVGSVLWGNSLAQITDKGYPIATVPGIVNLDETVYVMDLSGIIYGSALADPFTWPSFNYVGADYESDQGVALAKYSNYVVAFGGYTTQLFYNSGAQQGPNLRPVKNANVRVGCSFPRSVVSMSDTLIWVGRDQLSQGRRVYMMEGLQAVAVSDPYINRILENPSVTDAKAVPFKSSGHDFYILTLTVSGGVHVSYAFDLTYQTWYLWGTGNGIEWGSHFAATDGTYDYQLVDLGGYVITFRDNLYRDSNGISSTLAMTVQGVTNPIDAGNALNKYQGRLTIIADRTPGSTLTVTWTDDDYQTYANARTINLDQQRPATRRLGCFIRRAFRWTHTANTPFRAEALELALDLGNG
jgi:hypothetical protein